MKYVRSSETVINTDFILQPEQEWLSPAFFADNGSIVNLNITAGKLVYAEIMTLDKYNELTDNGKKSMKFNWNSAGKRFNSLKYVLKDGELVVVVKNRMYYLDNLDIRVMVNVELIGKREVVGV